MWPLGQAALTRLLRRFNLPIPVGPYTGAGDATAFGSPCPQQDPDLLAGSIVDQFSRVDAGVASKLQARADVPPPSEDCKLQRHGFANVVRGR